MKYVASRNPSVVTLMNTAVKEEQRRRRSMLLKYISSLRYLTRQGLAIRGHSDQNGNLHQLVKSRSEDDNDLELQEWIKLGKYQPPLVQNELMQLMYLQVLRTLLADIRLACFFSLIADETRDISGKEQLTVSLRWVNDSYEVNEDLIDLIDVEKTDAATLKSVIKDLLTSCSIPIDSCHGEAYDGASNMAGHLNGLASQIRREELDFVCALLGSLSQPLPSRLCKIKQAS